jgi:hypothetical protein
MIVGGQGPLDGGADEPVVPDAGVEREQPLHHPGPQAHRPAGTRAPWRSRPSWCFSIQMTASTRCRSHS